MLGLSFEHAMLGMTENDIVELGGSSSVCLS